MCSSDLMVVSDGGHGFRKALKRVWPKAKLQRCTFHAFLQVKRYTTSSPKTIADMELYMFIYIVTHNYFAIFL